MATFHFSRRAQGDLRAIVRYIHQDNPVAALTLVQEITERCRLYAATPLIGRDRSEDFGEGVRGFPFGNYIVLYRPITDGIVVIRIIHAAQNIRVL